MCCVLPPARSRRAFTLVEVAVTMALMAILLAVAFPQLTAAAALGGDQQAKMSANAVIDATAVTYGRTTSALPWEQVTVAGTTFAVPPRPSLDPALVATLAPDVTVLPLPTDPAQSPTEVSAATRQMSSGSTVWWRTGAAAFASAAGRRTCWLVWIDVDPPAGTATRARYMVFDAASDTEAALCTGRAAVNLAVNPSAGSPPDTGTTWQVPLAVNATAMSVAAASP